MLEIYIQGTHYMSVIQQNNTHAFISSSESHLALWQSVMLILETVSCLEAVLRQFFVSWSCDLMSWSWYWGCLVITARLIKETDSVSRLFWNVSKLTYFAVDWHGLKWISRYGLTTTCVVSIDTVAPLHDSVLAECACSKVEFLHQETSTLQLLPT